jgi:hypothetical protein
MTVTFQLCQGGFGTFPVTVVVNADARPPARAFDRSSTANPA